MLEIRFLTLKLLVLTFVCQSAVFVMANDRQKVLAILNKHCSNCHQKVNPEAGLSLDDLSLDNLSLDFADGKRIDDVQLDMWQRVHEPRNHVWACGHREQLTTTQLESR